MCGCHSEFVEESGQTTHIFRQAQYAHNNLILHILLHFNFLLKQTSHLLLFNTFAIQSKKQDGNKNKN